LLYRRFGHDSFNIGEALEALKPYFSNKLGISLLKRLSKMGLAEKVGTMEYKLVDLMEWLELKSAEYLEGRLRRYGGTSRRSSSSS